MNRDALIIGVNSYDRLKSLKSPSADAEAIAQLLEQYGEFRVKRFPAIKDKETGQSKVGQTTKVTLTQLEEALIQLFKPKGESISETALLFFSGHGLRKYRGITEGFLASSDVNTSVGHWGLSLQWLRRLLQASPVRQQIVWLDCCYSGELLNFHEEANPGQREGFDRCFIVASREYEVAYEEVAGNHGVLTAALLKRLNPKYYSNGIVDNITLVGFIKNELRNTTQRSLFTNFGGRIILTGKKIDVDNPIRSDTCPYKGLEYFDYQGEDPKYFYGRDKLVDKLINGVRESNFLAVLGASGSGKSSVVRAGLLYKLKQGLVLSGSEQWPIHIFRPSDEHQLQDLSITLTKLIETSITKLILVIDQFEEVFTHHKDDEKLRPFFEHLLNILEKKTVNQLCLIITMRADFYSKCTEYAKLAKAIQAHTQIITSMNEEELREAIVEPAKQVGLGIQSKLVETMVADVQKSPGSLPLLQYALTELWKKRQRGWLFLTTYNEMKGIKNILANRANEIYNELLDEEKLVAEKIFVELVELGEDTGDTRRQVYQKDLVTSQQSETLINFVIQKLADEKLLVTDKSQSDRSAVVNIAHDALIMHWPLLEGWVKKLRTKLGKKRTIEKAAKEWSDKNKSKEYLLQGSRLNEAKELCQVDDERIALSILEQEFVQQSIQWKMIKRSIFTFIISLVLGGFLYTFHKQQVAEMFAKARDIHALNESSSKRFKEGKKLEALSIAIEATEKFQTLTASDEVLRFRTLGTLQEAIYNTYEVNQLQDNTRVNKISFHPISGQMMAYGDSEGIIWLRQRDGQFIKKLQDGNNHTDVMTVTFSPDGNKLASGHKNGQVILWNLTNDHPYLSWQAHNDQVSDIRFNPKEEQIIATAGYDKQAKLWKLSPTTFKTSPEELEPPMQFDNLVNSIDFSPDGSQLAIGSEKGKVELWDVKNKKLKQFFQSNGKVKVVFNSNGRLFFTDDKEVKALDTGESVIPSQHTMPITDIHFSSDDQLLITASRDRTIKIWYSDNDNNFKFLENLTKYEDEIRDISISPDNQNLLSTASNFNKSVIKIWSIATFINKMKQKKQFPTVLSISFSTDQQNYAIAIPNNVYICPVDQKTECKSLKGTKSPQMIDFSPDNQHLAVGNADGEIQLWNINNDFPEGWLQSHHNALISSLSFSHDGNMLASGSHDNTVRLLDIKNHKVIKQPLIHERPIESIAFSFDDQLLASTEDNGVVKLWEVNSFQKLNQIKLHDSTTISALSFSHDNKWLAFASEGGTIGLWKFDNNTEENNPRYFSKELGDRIRSIILSSDDKILVSSSGDKIELWDIQAGILLKSLISPSQVQQLRFGTHDKILLIGGKKEIVSWLFDLKELLKQGCDHLQAYLKTHEKKICFFKN